ncbi:MAG TPA: OsmC family protein [Chroococcales cyanobacterium]
MAKHHHYVIINDWQGNLGTGTSGYRNYSRDHAISGEEKCEPIKSSSDPAFRGDRSRYNPEELLVASLSSCHMLWFLHLCADAGIVVTGYSDRAEGVMEERADGGGQFVSVTLNPNVTLAKPERVKETIALHEKAHSLCFIARSVNFRVECNPRTNSQ